MVRCIELVGGVCWLMLLASAIFAQGGTGSGLGGGRGGGGGMSGARENHRASSPADYSRGATPPRQAALTPHCGRYLSNGHCFELVFTMAQARIYVYDKAMKPQTARDLQVQMSLQVPGERETRRILFRYAPLPRGAVEQDCVVANFDFAQLGDQEVPLTIAFFNLPTRPQATVSFTPLFTKDAIRPYVAQVAVSEADRGGVLGQRVCPVSGDVLGTKGRVIKLLVGEVPIYLCSKECIRAVRQSPEQYLPRPPAPPGNSVSAPAGNR
jgi:hypothetical protein